MERLNLAAHRDQTRGLRPGQGTTAFGCAGDGGAAGGSAEDGVSEQHGSCPPGADCCEDPGAELACLRGDGDLEPRPELAAYRGAEYRGHNVRGDVACDSNNCGDTAAYRTLSRWTKLFTKGRFLGEWVSRSGLSKCPRSRARSVSMDSKVSLRSEFLNAVRLLKCLKSHERMCEQRTVAQCLDDTWPEPFSPFCERRPEQTGTGEKEKDPSFFVTL